MLFQLDSRQFWIFPGRPWWLIRIDWGVLPGVQVRISVLTDICHRGCAYTVPQTVQRHGVYSAAYGTVHYKEPLKSFEIRVGHESRLRASFCRDIAMIVQKAT